MVEGSSVKWIEVEVRLKSNVESSRMK